MKLINPLTRRGALLACLVLLAGCGTPPPAPPRAAAPDLKTQRVFPHESGRFVLDVGPQGCQLAVYGALDHAAVRRIGPALQAVSTAGCAQRTAVLHSSGGVIGDAITLGAMLRNRGYQTHLPVGQQCDSTCILVFAAGLARTAPAAGAAGRFQFAQIPPDQDFGRQTCATELSRGQQLTLTRYLRAMLPETAAHGAYQRWLQSDCQHTVQLTAEQALALGLVTGLH